MSLPDVYHQIIDKDDTRVGVRVGVLPTQPTTASPILFNKTNRI